MASKQNGRPLIVSIREAARMVGVDRRIISNWITEGLPIASLPGTGQKPMKRILVSDLEHFMRGYRSSQPHDSDERTHDTERFGSITRIHRNR